MYASIFCLKTSTGQLQGLWDRLAAGAASVGAAITKPFSNPGPLPQLGDPMGGEFQQQYAPAPQAITIPQRVAEAAAAPRIEQDNRQISNTITVPVTINATVNNTTPQGIAGAVAGAGQSVAGEVKKALSDGGQ